jgi:tripartite-type tricarboxylate transporter receptor subunit TctC
MRRSISLVLVCATVSAPALAQTYPSRPIRVVVPFPAGGGTDIVARIVMRKVADSLGGTAVIDNRAGAGGTIGTELVAKAPADGYTIGIVSGSHAINPALYRKLAYDSINDFAPITLLVSGPGLLVVHPSLPAKTVPELISLARARPGQLSYASAGNGTPPHLAAELFKSMANVQIDHVPYKGNTAAFADLVSGQVVMSFPTIPSALPLVKSGRLRVLAVTSRERSRIVPDVPTIAASGLPGYEASSWYAALAPAGAPAAIVNRLHQAMAKALDQADVRETLVKQGLDPVGNTPAQFAQVLRSDMDKWAKVVSASGARID